MGFPFAEIVRARTIRWAGAAVLALIFSGGFVVYSDSPQEPQIYTTRTAQMRAIMLDDGSVVHLNTRTRLEWLSDARERRAILHEGEALFEIEPDATRPFRIEVAGSEIQALGTRLNVYQRANGQVSVTVLEGAVQVEGRKAAGEPTWRRDLHANQCMRYGPDGPIHDVRTSPMAGNAARWLEGVLVFSDKPLPQVLDELARYTDWHIVVGDPRLNAMQVGGTIKTGNIRAALARLEKVAPIVVTEHDGTFTLSYRTAEAKHHRGR